MRIFTHILDFNPQFNWIKLFIILFIPENSGVFTSVLR